MMTTTQDQDKTHMKTLYVPFYLRDFLQGALLLRLIWMDKKQNKGWLG